MFGWLEESALKRHKLKSKIIHERSGVNDRFIKLIKNISVHGVSIIFLITHRRWPRMS